MGTERAEVLCGLSSLGIRAGLAGNLLRGCMIALRKSRFVIAVFADRRVDHRCSGDHEHEQQYEVRFETHGDLYYGNYFAKASEKQEQLCHRDEMGRMQKGVF